MKSKCFLAAVMVAFLCLNACSTPGKNSTVSDESFVSGKKSSLAETVHRTTAFPLTAIGSESRFPVPQPEIFPTPYTRN